MAGIQREIGLQVRVLLRTKIVCDIVEECEREYNFVDFKLLAFAKVKQILLVRAVTGDTAVNEFVICPIHLPSSEEFLLSRAETPDVRIAQHQHPLSPGCVLDLDIVGGAQPELILMHKNSFFSIGHVLQRGQAQLMIKTTETVFFVLYRERSAQSQRDFTKQRHDYQTDYDRGKSKQNRFHNWVL